MIATISYVLAFVGLLCFGALSSRMVKLQYKVQRLDYVLLHGFIAMVLIPAVARLLITGIPDLSSIGAIGVAVTYISVTTQRGQKFKPSPFMTSKVGDL